MATIPVIVELDEMTPLKTLIALNGLQGVARLHFNLDAPAKRAAYRAAPNVQALLPPPAQRQPRQKFEVSNTDALLLILYGVEQGISVKDIRKVFVEQGRTMHVRPHLAD